MQGKARSATTLVAGALSVSLVVMGIPLAALGLGEDTDVLNGALSAGIAEPLAGSEFSRLDEVRFVDGTVATLCPVVSRTWDFGDQTSLSTVESPSHQYDSLGTKEATLVVAGGCGRVDTASVIFHIVNLKPLATLTVAPASAAPGQAISLDGAGSADLDGDIVSYQFVIDGANQALQSAPTFSQTFTSAGQHTLGLRVVDNEGRVSDLVQAGVEVAPGQLANLAIAPDLATLAAGGSALFAATGTDQYGNALDVAPSWSSTCGSIEASGSFAAPTSLGACEVRAAQDGIEAFEAFGIIAGPLASIAISGPDSLVAGTHADYALEGSDAFGNPVALAQATLGYDAPTTAGMQNLCYEESGISACKAIEVLPDALAAIVLNGPSEAIAGQSAHFDVAGFDQYGNPVALAVSAFDWAAPTLAGPDQACYEEQGIASCAGINVLPDALANIAVTGLLSIEVGDTATYMLGGSDQYGNAVALAQGAFDWTAPTLAGPAQACYEESGIQGCLAIDVFAGPVSVIAVSGPAEVVAGNAASYALSATDPYGNPVALAQSSLEWTAPTIAGATQVCYTEGDASGCADVTVLPDMLASILVSGPDEMVAGATASFGLAGFDQYGNAVALAQAAFDYTAPVLAGATQACYEESGIAGCHGVSVIADALDSIEVTGPGSVQAGTEADYILAGFDQWGNPVALAQAALHWMAPEAPGPQQVCYGEQAIEGCASVEVTPAGLAVITVSGPDELVAGGSATYDLAGFDPFGNAVALAQSSLAWDAPTQAGSQLVCYQEEGIQGCIAMEVVPGALDSITIAGPSSLIAGQGADYALAGFDAYGNAVALAQSSLAYTAGTAAGLEQVCYEESGISACQGIEVLPDALASIAVSGPASMVVGSTADFGLAGFDQYGNAVALAQSTLGWTAPNAAGPGEVCYAEAGISGCASLVYVADTLNNIAVSGPASVVAGQMATFALDGTDQYGNPVALAQSTLDWTAPTGAGPAQACYEELGIQGCKDVDVLAASLFTIDVSGPSELQVGETATYALAGFDQYGNAVPLDQGSLDFTAPTAPGSAMACYEEDGISGCALVDVVHGPLASIVVSGPDSIVAGQAADFDLAGFDAYGNAVALAQSTLGWTAPNGAGSADVCYEEQGILACKTLEVLPDALARIDVAGPATAQAGSSHAFALAGFDQYDNAVALAQQGLDWTAPTIAGPAQACYEEFGITGCADVDVTHADLDRIDVTGPASMPAGSLASFDVAGFDAFDNAVPLAVSAFDYTAPGLVGPAFACYAEQGVEGCAALDVVAGPLARVVVSPGESSTNVNQGKDIQFSAAGEDAFGNAVALGPVTWSADRGIISSGGLYKAITAGEATVMATSGDVSGSAPVHVLNTLKASIVTNFDSYAMGSPVRGYAKALFEDGDAVKGAKVTLSFVGLSPLGMMCGGEFEGLTNAGGILSFQAPPDCARFIGDYRIDGSAIWKTNRGAASKVYHITL